MTAVAEHEQTSWIQEAQDSSNAGGVIAPVTTPVPGVVLPDPPAWVHQAPWAANIEDKLKGFQKFVRWFMMSRPGSAAWLGMASGKMQPLDSLVLTPQGFVPMGDISLGHQVITPSGEIASIDGVFPHGVQPIYRLTLSDGRTVEAGGGHLWSVSTYGRRHRGLPSVVKTTDELIADLRCANGDSKWSIQAIDDVELGDWSSTLEPYLLGVLLGDGSLSGGSIALSNPDPQVLDAVRQALPVGCSLVNSSATSPDGLNWYITTPRGQANPVLDEIRRLGLHGTTAADKHVPEQLRHASSKDRLALLQGLLDTDGTPNKTSGFDFTVKSKALAHDVAWLVRSLGGSAHYRVRTLRSGPYAGNDYHRVTGRLPAHHSPFRTGSKLGKLTPHYRGSRRDYPSLHLAIRDIEHVRDAPAQCISVDHPSHEYITDGFVRTHNTLVTLSTLSHLREPGHILVVAPRNIAVDTWPQEVFDWGFPLRVTSLNITPPGMLDALGRPLEKQRELKTAEFRRFVDDTPVAPAGLYTIGIDRFPELVDRLAHGGPPRTRPYGVPHPDGAIDLDACRDVFEQLLSKFTKQDKAVEKELATAREQGIALDDPPVHFGKHVVTAVRGAQVIDLRPATKSGAPPTVVLGHPDPEKARILRDQQLREALAGIAGELLGAPHRVDARISHADYRNWPFPTVVLDEAQGFKNPDTSRWQALIRVRPMVKRMIQLSGTPAPEGAHEIWPQISLLDGGASLGSSYDEHLNAFFAPDRMVNNKVVKWKITPHNEAALYGKITHLAVSARNDELKLPGYEPAREHRVSMGADLLEAYERFKSETLISVLLSGLDALRQEAYDEEMSVSADPDKATAAAAAVALDDAAAHTIEAVNGGVLRGKLMQFAAGSLYIDIDKDHPEWAKATELTRKPITRLHRAKLDCLEKLLVEHFESADPDRGCVLVAYRFDYERAQVLDMLSRHRFADGSRAYNGMPDTKGAWNRREIPVMLIHPKSAGHGLNLQHGGHRLIWHTLPDSNEQFQQTPARLNRVGQTRKVRVDMIVTEGTVDEDVPGSLNSKEGSQARLLNATRADLSSVRDAALRLVCSG